jgi:hypothetical protein
MRDAKYGNRFDSRLLQRRRSLTASMLESCSTDDAALFDVIL